MSHAQTSAPGFSALTVAVSAGDPAGTGLLGTLLAAPFHCVPPFSEFLSSSLCGIHLVQLLL